MSEHLRPDLLLRYASNELPARERAEADAHLRTCGPCRGMLSVQQRSFSGPDAPTMAERSRRGAARDGTTTLPAADRPNPFGDERTVTEPVELLPHRMVPKPPATRPSEAQQAVTASGAQRAVTAPSGAQRVITAPREAIVTTPARPTFQVSHTAATHEDLPPVSSGPQALVGRKVGDYILEELVGKGGMAAVYRAVHPLIGKRVAVKVMLKQSQDGDFAARMIQEAQTVNAIDHPNIIEVLGAGTLADGRTFLVMQYLDGAPLSGWLRDRTDDVPGPVVFGLLEQLFSALGAAHRAGVMHRDIKPANVMLVQLDAPIPTVKVVDFGLAKGENASVTTSPDIVLGTPGFVSPEQIRGERATSASDLYSAGLVAYTLVTRSEPYSRDEHALVTLRRQLKEPPPRIPLRPGIPSALADLIADCAALNPLERPDSAAEVVARLQAIAKGASPGPAKREPKTKTPPDGLHATRQDRPAVSRSSDGLSVLRRDEPPAAVQDAAEPPLSLSDLPSVRSRTPWFVLGGLVALIAAATWFLVFR